MSIVVSDISLSPVKARKVFLSLFLFVVFLVVMSVTLRAATYKNTEVPLPNVATQKSLPQSTLTPPGPFDETLSYRVVADVRADGSVRFTETIVENFASPARGILRERFVVEEIGGELRNFPVRDLRVDVSPEANERTNVDIFGDELTIRVGEPDERITGVHTYELSYTVDGMVDVGDDAEPFLNFDLIAGRPYPIRQFEGVVTLPVAPTSVVCVADVYGDKYDCGGDTKGNQFAVATTNIVSGEQLGVRMTFPAGSFPDLAAPLAVEGNNPVEAFGLGALTLGLVLAGVVAALRLHNRSLVPSGATLNETFAVRYGQDTPTDAPVDSHDGAFGDGGTVGGEPTVEFTPPQKLRPAHMGVLVGAMSPRELFVSTMVDLAARDWVAFHPSGNQWTITWKGNGTTALLPFEADTLGRVFEGRTSVTSKELGGRTTNPLPVVFRENKKRVVEEAKQLGLIGRVRLTRSAIAAFAGGVLASCVPFVFLTAMTRRPSPSFAILLTAVLVSLVFTTTRTPLGVAMRWRVLGFKRLFTESENYHARLAASENIMRQYMGYAVEFGEINKWMSAFPNTQTDPTFLAAPMGAFAFVSSVNAHTPRASSGSSSSFGGFSGGGSSGGSSSGGASSGGGGRW